jgi:hypothetical protein
MLSVLEQQLVELTALDPTAHPAQLLGILTEMVRQPAKLAAERLDKAAGGLPFAKALRAAKDFCVAGARCAHQVQPSPWRQVLRVFGHHESLSSKQRKQVRQLVQRGLSVLEDVFAQFALGFSPAGADVWQQTAVPFLTELKRVADPT